MFARDFLSNESISITHTSNIIDAQHLMNKYKVSHLPVVQDEMLYLGLISESDIQYTIDNNESKIVTDFTLYDDKILDTQHIIEAYEIINRSNLTLLPVVSKHNTYLGALTLQSLIRFFKKIVAFQSQGAILEITVAISDYSASQITQIIENYDIRILSMYVVSSSEAEQFDIILKLNTTEIAGVIKSLERYGYLVHSYALGDTLIEDMYSTKIDTFLRYLNM